MLIVANFSKNSFLIRNEKTRLQILHRHANPSVLRFEIFKN